MLWALVLGWFAATLGHAMVLGRLPVVVMEALPALAGRGAMPAALMLFVAGVLALGLLAYVLGTIVYQLARRRAA